MQIVIFDMEAKVSWHIISPKNITENSQIGASLTRKILKQGWASSLTWPSNYQPEWLF